jgi:uncharacterized membrane protein
MEKLMTEKLSDSLKIAAVLSNASNAEKREFDRRLNSYLDTRFSLRDLTIKHNHLQKLHQEKLKEQNKTEIIFVIMLLIAIVLGSLFSSSNLYDVQSLILIGLVISVYAIKKDTYEKTYVLEYRMFEIEIDRCNNDLKQYRYHPMYENRIVEEEPIAQGVILEKWHEQRQEAFDELKLEILKSMYLLPKN